MNNKSGALRMYYFISYMKLIMNTMNCSVDKAKEIVFQRTFGNNEHSLGEFSYQEFIKAYEYMKSHNTRRDPPFREG